MKINILFIFLLFGAILPAQPVQEGYIEGKVTDAKSGLPLPGSAVSISSQTGTITGIGGLYRLAVASNDSVVLEVSFVGYHSFTSKPLKILPGSSTTLNVRLQPDVSTLEEVVVSAGKFEQRLAEVTVSLDVIKPRLVQNKNLVTLRTALQQAPGVNVTDGQANIRSGSGWTYGAGTRVQTLVDGMPLISGDANQVQWDLVPIYSLDRIEVLKGASSVLYGSAALNGVINVLTHPRPQKQEFTVSLYSGFYDAPQRKSLKWWDKPRFNSGFNFDLQQPLGPQSGLVLSGGYFDDQGFRYLDDEQRSRLFAKYFHQFKKVKGLEFSLATHINYSDLGNALLWESDSLGYIPADSSITRAYGWDFYVDPTLTYRHGRFRHLLQGRYLKLNNNTFDDQSDFTNSSDLSFGQYQLQWFFKNLVSTLGLSSAYSASQSVLFVGEHTSTNNAAFLQIDYKPWKWLNVNGGVRYETFRLDDRFFEKPVFRAGASAEVLRGTFVRASYGEAFRFPSVAEAFTATKVGIFTIYPNPELKPESGYTMEAGVRQMFRLKKIKGYLDFAVFNMRYSDMIEYNASFWGPFKPPGFGFGFSSINIGETSISGLELATALEGELGPKSTYRLLAGYTYTVPRALHPTKAFAIDNVGLERTYLNSSSNPKNNILKYRYQHLAKLDAEVEYRPVTLGLSLRYNSFMQNIDTIFVLVLPTVEDQRQRHPEGDFIVDARASVAFFKKWKAALIIDNLLNREVMIRPAYLGAPRSFSLRLTYKL